MEKCTFCSQRIIFAKDKAKDEGRDVRDGEITPACAQACPSKAIVFGNLMDPESNVSRLSKGERGYHVLQEINTKPSITYLKKVKWDKA
jgi:molybdopterin-containing oxidoreductase family iron-sulfur binding subunit